MTRQISCPGLFHPWKIRCRKLKLFPIARRWAVRAIILVELWTEMRPVLGLLSQAIGIEFRQSDFRTEQNDEILPVFIASCI
jgi:hypothetical protein